MANTKKVAKWRGSLPRTSADLIERLEALDLRVAPKPGNSHLLVTNSAGRLLGVMASSPSDGRALLNTISDLKRSGVDIRNMKLL